MAAPEGNQFWKLRAKHGRESLFADHQKLWKAAEEYFDWCTKNPLKEQKVFCHDGNIIKTNVTKLRAYTLSGLCLYLQCSEAYFRQAKITQKDNKDFLTVLETIQQVIYTQKLEGAAAGLLNANIVARDLGLKDASTVQITKVGKDAADEEYE